MIHLAYCDNQGKKGERELDLILSGTKTMILRGAAGRKIPHSRVFPNDELYFMEKGTSLISAKAIVSQVEEAVSLSEEGICEMLERFQPALCFTEKQKQRWHKKCLCIVGFTNVEAIDPLPFDKQGNMDDWLIIEKIEDVVVGTSIPYSYTHSKFKKGVSPK